MVQPQPAPQPQPQPAPQPQPRPVELPGQSRQGVNLKQPNEFTFNPAEWSNWRKRFERYRAVSDLTEAPGKRQVDMLCYCMGGKAEEIIASFGLSASQLQNYDVVIEKFENHFIPKANLIYHRAKFLQRSQGQN